MLSGTSVLPPVITTSLTALGRAFRVVPSSTPFPNHLVLRTNHLRVNPSAPSSIPTYLVPRTKHPNPLRLNSILAYLVPRTNHPNPLPPSSILAYLVPRTNHLNTLRPSSILAHLVPRTNHPNLLCPSSFPTPLYSVPWTQRKSKKARTNI